MLINWFTVIAQVINFVILIYLLKRFLYGPIIKAMEAREKAIADQLEKADKARQEANAMAAGLKKEQEEFARAKETMHVNARGEVAIWRENALETARNEVELARTAWVEKLEGEKQSLLLDVKTRVADLVLEASQKVLDDLAEGRLEEQVVRTFLRKCSLERESAQFRQIGKQTTALVLTGFPLNEESRASIRGELMQVFPGFREIALESSPDIGLGLRLVAGDFQVEWNLTWYLRNLEASMLDKMGSARRAA